MSIAKLTWTPSTTDLLGLYGLWLEANGEALISNLAGVLMRSLDHGRTWTRVPVGNRWGLGAVARSPEGEILIACTGGRLLSSTDDGASWKTTQLGHKSSLHHIGFREGLTVVSGCDRVAWRRKSNEPWQEAKLPKIPWARGACIDTSGRAFVGIDSLYKAKPRAEIFVLDSGDSEWRSCVTWNQGRLCGPFTSGRELVALGEQGFVARSDDGGSTWKESKSSGSENFSAGCFVGSRLFAGTEEGAVLCSDDFGESWTLLLATGSGPDQITRIVSDGSDLVLVTCDLGVFRGVSAAFAAKEAKLNPSSASESDSPTDPSRPTRPRRKQPNAEPTRARRGRKQESK
jgi:hypothetical protein